MDLNEVASPACRVGQPNVDGSIGGDQRHALTPNRPTQQHFHYDRELCRGMTYDRAEKMRKVDTLTLRIRNVLRAPRIKTLPSEVMTI